MSAPLSLGFWGGNIYGPIRTDPFTLYHMDETHLYPSLKRMLPSTCTWSTRKKKSEQRKLQARELGPILRSYKKTFAVPMHCQCDKRESCVFEGKGVVKTNGVWLYMQEEGGMEKMMGEGK